MLQKEYNNEVKKVSQALKLNKGDAIDLVVDGGSWWKMSDDQDGCEWVNVSSGTGPPG